MFQIYLVIFSACDLSRVGTFFSVWAESTLQFTIINGNTKTLHTLHSFISIMTSFLWYILLRRLISVLLPETWTDDEQEANTVRAPELKWNFNQKSFSRNCFVIRIPGRGKVSLWRLEKVNIGKIFRSLSKGLCWLSEAGLSQVTYCYTPLFNKPSANINHILWHIEKQHHNNVEWKSKESKVLLTSFYPVCLLKSYFRAKLT